MVFFTTPLVAAAAFVSGRPSTITTTTSTSTTSLNIFNSVASSVPNTAFTSAIRHSSYVTGRIDSDEDIVFFPTIGKSLNATHYEIPIHGWIFEPHLESTSRFLLKKFLKKTLKVTNREERRILDRRLEPFLVHNEEYKAPRIQFCGAVNHNDEANNSLQYTMPRSTRNGHFHATLHIHKDEVALDENSNIVRYEAESNDGRTFVGAVHIMKETGVSIISDIDDTIKVSNVTDTKRLLRNTFLEEFKEVEGMSAVYNKWQSKYDDVRFHYVSSSPYQLFEEIDSFRSKFNFPEPTYHLKTIRVKDKSLLNLFADPVVTKTAEIESIINKFPDRKYILVGDSGEKDPEVYAAMERKYPDQVVGIYIRQVSGKKKKIKKGETKNIYNSKRKVSVVQVVNTGDAIQQRIENVFANTPRSKWKLFSDAKELEELSPTV